MHLPHIVIPAALSFALTLPCTSVLAQEKPQERATSRTGLHSADPDQRLHAIDSLSSIGSRAADAIPSLIGAFDDSDAGVRWHAAVALGKIGPAAVPALVSALKDGQVNIRRGAALALGMIGSDANAAVPALISALTDNDELVREHAAEALGRFGSEARPALEGLITMLSDDDPYANGAAAEALHRIGHEAVPGLVTALRDSRENVRWCAAIALGKIGPGAPEAVPALVRALTDSSENVRWCSALALTDMGSRAKEAIPALSRLQYDRDADVRWAAHMALETIDPSSLQTKRSWSATAAIIDSLVPLLMNELHVPGVSIALLDNRTLVWSRCYGVADAARRTPVNDGTLFEACSMTKPVFAYTVLKLVEDGKLDLDRPLVEYLDEGPDQAYRRLITARMVLSHTTGLPNWRKGEEERDGPLPVLFKPGSRFSYSGEGMLYLQRVVEHITGELLDVYADRTLLRPMGLEHQMSYAWRSDLDPRLATGHNTDGTVLRKTHYTHANAAYTLYTTAQGYAKFLTEILKTDRSATYSLSQHFIDAMLHPQVDLDIREPIERPGQARGLAVSWGLGWSINTTEDGTIAHHSGANRSGFRCFSQFRPDRGSGIVIMTNSISGGELWTRLITVVGDL